MTVAALPNGWHKWWPFAALCIAAWVRSNAAESISASASTLSSQAVACVLAGLLFAAIAQRQQPTMVHTKTAIAGALLLCGPHVGLFLSRRVLTGTDALLALAAVPIVIAVAMGSVGSAAGLSPALLWPGVVALSVMLLLVPGPNITDAPSIVVISTTALITGLGSVLFVRSEENTGLWQASAAFLGAGLVFATGAFARQVLNTPTVLATVADFVLAVCAILSLQRLRPSQYAAQYVVVPLALLVEGLVLMRPRVSLRSVIGLMSLAIAVVALLRRQDDAEINIISLR